MRWKTISLLFLLFVACIPDLPDERLSVCLDTCEPKSRACFGEVATCHAACALQFSCSTACDEWNDPKCVAICTDQRALCDTLCEGMGGVCIGVVVNCAEECIAEFEDALHEELE
jgi:hypothetical protein